MEQLKLSGFAQAKSHTFTKKILGQIEVSQIGNILRIQKQIWEKDMSIIRKLQTLSSKTQAKTYPTTWKTTIIFEYFAQMKTLKNHDAPSKTGLLHHGDPPRSLQLTPEMGLLPQQLWICQSVTNSYIASRFNCVRLNPQSIIFTS